VVARRSANDQHARGRRRILLPRLGLAQALARLEPFGRKLELGIGESWAGFARARILAVLGIDLPGDGLEAVDRRRLLLVGGVGERLAEACAEFLARDRPRRGLPGSWLGHRRVPG